MALWRTATAFQHQRKSLRHAWGVATSAGRGCLCKRQWKRKDPLAPSCALRTAGRKPKSWDSVKVVQNMCGGVYFLLRTSVLPRSSLFVWLAWVHWRMFPKMGSCVSERVWVSLVKEASDTGGIPSPRALWSGLGAHSSPVQVRPPGSDEKPTY